MATVTVWNEYRHERDDEVAEVYPDGIHGALADLFGDHSHDVWTATLDEPDHGLPPDVLDETDVLVWWSHLAQDEVEDAVVDRIQDRVLAGMGFLALHSAHHSRPFMRLMGTSCDQRWRQSQETERLWVVDPGHEIAAGLDNYVTIPEAETWSEPFDVPEPDRLVFASWFEGGEIFRSGCCYRRGKGKVFYFRPGHEFHPIFYQDEVRTILANAVEWATPTEGPPRKQGHAPVPPVERDG